MKIFSAKIFLFALSSLYLLSACNSPASQRRSDIYDKSRNALAEAADSVGAEMMLRMVDSLAGKEVDDLRIADMTLEVASFLFQNHDDNVLVEYVDGVAPAVAALDANRDSLEAKGIDLELMVSTVYLDLGIYNRTAQELNLALKEAERLKLNDRVSVIYNNLSSIAMARGNVKEGVALLNKSLEICKKLDDREGMIYSYNNLASAYKDLDDDDKALEHRMMAVHLLDQPEDSMVRAMVMRNLSGDYFRMGEVSMALRLLEPTLDYMERHNLTNELPLTRAHYALLLAETGRPEEARSLFRRAVEDAERQNSPMLGNILEDYADFCKKQGSLNEAYTLLERRYKIGENIGKAGQEKKNEAVNQLYERELQKSRNITQQLAEANSRIRLSAWIILAILILACAAFVYFLIRERNISRRVAKLRKAADERWSGAAIQLHHLNEFVKSLIPSLQEVQELLSGRNSRKANDMVRRITASLMQEVSVGQQENPLATVDTEFKNKLLTRFPGLTTRDLRLCMLLMQGYSSKEIAHISCCEVRSVDTARNRLRKKCGIPSSTDLSKFFLSLAAEK